MANAEGGREEPLHGIWPPEWPPEWLNMQSYRPKGVWKHRLVVDIIIQFVPGVISCSKHFLKNRGLCERLARQYPSLIRNMLFRNNREFVQDIMRHFTDEQEQLQSLSQRGAQTRSLSMDVQSLRVPRRSK